MKRNSIILLCICLVIVLRFDLVTAQVSKLIKEDFKIVNDVIYNQNVDFEYRAVVKGIGDEYCVLDQSKLKLLNGDGTAIWEKEVSTQNVLYETGKSSVVMVEKKSGDIFIIDLDGKIRASKFGLGAVKGLKYFDEQYVGLLKTDGTLIVLDNKLETISHTVLPKGEIIDFSINIERQDIVAVVLDLSRKDFNTKLVIATFNGEIISGSNLFSEIAYALWLTKDTIYVPTDSQLMVYDYDCNLQSTQPFDRTVGKLLYDEKGHRFYFNVLNEAGQIENPKAENAILVYSESGEVIAEYDAVLKDIRGMQMMGNRLMIYNKEEVAFFNEKGDLVDRYKGDDEIVDVIVADSDHFGIAYINHVNIYMRK